MRYIPDMQSRLNSDILLAGGWEYQWRVFEERRLRECCVLNWLRFSAVCGLKLVYYPTRYASWEIPMKFW